MRLLPDSKPGLASTQTRGYRRASAAPLLAVLVLGLFGFLAAGLAAAGPVTAAQPTATAKHTAIAKSTTTAKSTAAAKPTKTARPTTAPQPTMSPIAPGRHVYDYGSVLSASSATQAETLAADIEARGGGRVVVYTTAQPEDMPDTSSLIADWQINGMLLTGSDGEGELMMGPILKAKLGKDQASAIDTSSGPQTLASWIMSSLARADAFLSGTNVFDGTGVLDVTGKQKAEAAATALSGKIGAPVYIDISLGDTDPSTAAFFNGAGLSSDFDNALIIALSVSDKEIAGYVQTNSSNLVVRVPQVRAIRNLTR